MNFNVFIVDPQTSVRRAVSWQTTAWAVKQRTGNPALKLLLLTLANYADDEGCCWPSQKTLSEDTEQSADSVQRKLKQLEASGLIRKVVRPGKQGRWSSRTYFLDMGVAEKSKPQSAARPDDEPCRNEPSTMPQNRDDHAATGTVTMPHSSAALTVIEPSIEPSEGENRARAKRLPHDFGLDRETQEWAVHRLGSAEAVYASMFKFEHHHRSKGSQYVDWMARAHLWIEDDARKATKEAVNDKSVVAAAKRLNEKIRSFDAVPTVTELSWDGIVGLFVKTVRWTRNVDICGNAPPSPDCRAPKHILAKYGLAEVAA